MPSQTLDTIGSLIEHGHYLWFHCNKCGRHHKPDMPALAEKIGRDAPCMHKDLIGRVRCQACGSRDCAVTLHPPT
jgi:hypothetical protein